mmetsp:Transcript_25008/g.48866  ORF Transcript_25008/g.48866 Transcript_25008/m.48866 type:complete len:279 (+) Transcript_25008:47-883(+)
MAQLGSCGTQQKRIRILAGHAMTALNGVASRPALCTARVSMPTTMLTSASGSTSIAELKLGDDPNLWHACGFAVSPNGETWLGSVKITLTGEGGGLLAWQLRGFSQVDPDLLEDVQTRATAGEDSVVCEHRNGVTQLGEIVLYAQNIDQIVKRFELAGIRTHGQAGSKELKGGTHKLATFYFDGVRLLIFGPIDPLFSPSQNPRIWMFPKHMEKRVVLMGWLPVVRDMAVLKSLLGDKAGVVRDARQKGRQICSMPPERSGLTGTFAFLSDGAGHIFG